jgi:hypothetical protein
VTWKQKPVGADLLRLFTSWVEGVELAAGQCLLAAEPAPRALVGERCRVDGCQSIICGATPHELHQHQADHRRRCHG